MTTQWSAASTRRHPNWKGILCLEADWWDDMNASASVRPILELAGAGWKGGIPFRHRDVATREEFWFYLDRWTTQRFDRFPILYLAMHGEKGVVTLRHGKDGDVTLDELAEKLEGRCDGRIIHFGSCGTMGTDARILKRFLRTTKALAITGYRGDSDWMVSAAFEVLLLDAFQYCALDGRGMRAVQTRIKRDYRALVRQLDFRMVLRPRS